MVFDNLPKIKDGLYVINLNEYESKRTHWIALYMNSDGVTSNVVTCFDSFGVEHIPRKTKKSTGNRNLTTNIFRIQTYDSIMCGEFRIGFIDFMLKGKSLLEHAILFSPNKYENNDKIILKYC